MITWKRRLSQAAARLAVAAALTLPGLAAWAAPPFAPDLVTGGNRWTITFYDDSSPGHAQWATQGICFYYAGVVGTHQRYLWVSDTYPDWNGRATQEGDQVFMHGDFRWPTDVKEGGHDGMQWELVTVSPRDLGAGHWKEWVEDGGTGITIGFGNTVLRRAGKCAIDVAADALKAYQDLPLPNPQVENPMGVPPDVYLKAQ